jgi:hypothetical protein
MSGKTRETQFREIPAERCPLLMVASGVECTTALREAADLEDGVRRLLLMGAETGIDGSIAYLCEFALEIAAALRSASRE